MRTLHISCCIDCMVCEMPSTLTSLFIAPMITELFCSDPISFFCPIWFFFSWQLFF